MPTRTTIAMALTVILSISFPAFANEAQSVFDSIYGQRLKAARATTDRADDHALAKELLETAGKSTDTPALLALLCETSYDLSSKHADGFATAAQAMTLLAESVEANRTGAREKLVDVLMKQSRLGKPDEREAAGEELIDTLLAMGDEKMETKKWSEATSDYRRAMTIAAPKKSPKLESIKARLELATRRDRAEKQIARLSEKLLADANDSATAEEIVKLYVVEFDDPKSALPFLNRVKDEQLKKLVPLAARTSQPSDGGEWLALGEWYRSLAGGSPGFNELPLLKHARIALARTVEATETSDLAKQKARLLLEDVTRNTEKIESTIGAHPPTEKKSEQWISKDATYSTSSNVNNDWRPVEGLLKGGENLIIGEFAFTTNEAPGQYIVIDLGDARNITKIWIENRRREKWYDRAKNIEVYLSNKSGERGVKIWSAKSGEKEWTIPLRPVKIRYITIAQPKTVSDPLHLAQVKVFGPE